MGPSAAKYLLFSGELIDAERALRTGLVDELHPAGELDKRVAEFCRVLASRSLLTQAAAKEFADGRTDRDAHWTEQARGSDDTAEGSPPSWSAARPASRTGSEARTGYAVPGSPASARHFATSPAGAFSGEPAS